MNWKTTEKFVARRSGGRLQRASGKGKTQKGDVKTEEALYEVKSSKRKKRKGYYIIITRDMLKKIVDESLVAKRDPKLVIAIGEPYQYFCMSHGSWDFPTLQRQKSIVSYYMNKSITFYLSDLEVCEEAHLFVEDMGGSWQIARM